MNTMPARKRILFLAEGATMAHFVRPLALADSLDPNDYEIHFWAPRRFAPHLENKPYSIGVLDSMPGEQFLSNLAHGRPLFPTEVLRRYVHEDRRLLRELEALYHYHGIETCADSAASPGSTSRSQRKPSPPQGSPIRA